MIKKQHLQLIGLFLVFIGTAITLYDLFYSDGNASITKSNGFYIFIIGLLISVLSQFFFKEGTN